MCCSCKYCQKHNVTGDWVDCDCHAPCYLEDDF